MPKIVPNNKNRSIDWVGSILLSFGIIALLLGFVWGGNEYAWDSWQIISLFASSIILLYSFIFVEKRVQEPILPLSLFKNSIFSISMIIIFLMGVGMFGTILYIPLFSQLVLGTNATDAGTILTPLMLGLVFSSITAGQIVSRTGRYKLIAVGGIALSTLGMYLLSQMSVNTTQTDLLIRMILTGVGIGSTLPIFNLAVQNAFDHSMLGVATSSIQLFRSIGATVGMAVLGGVLNNSIASQAKELTSEPLVAIIKKANAPFDIQHIDANVLQNIVTGDGRKMIEAQLHQLPQALQPPALGALQQFIDHTKILFASSITEVFFIATIFTGASFFIALFLKEIPLRKTHAINPVEEAGKELAVEEGSFAAKDEPTLR